jgi:hypothetical protein
MGEGKRKGFFFWFLGLRLDCHGRKERLTDLLVGVGNPQHT